MAYERAAREYSQLAAVCAISHVNVVVRVVEVISCILHSRVIGPWPHQHSLRAREWVSASIGLIAYGPVHLTADQTMHAINRRVQIALRTKASGFSCTNKSYSQFHATTLKRFICFMCVFCEFIQFVTLCFDHIPRECHAHHSFIVIFSCLPATIAFVYRRSICSERDSR